MFSETAKVDIEEGWNLISVPFQQDSQPVDQVFASIAGQYRDIWAYAPFEQTDQWKHFHPENIAFSDLDTIEIDKGYWLYAYQKTALTITGDPVTTDQTIELKQGWNLIGWLFLYEEAIEAALSNLQLGIDYDKVVRFNPVTQEYEYYSEALSQFDKLEQGKGYYIHALKDCLVILLYNAPPFIIDIKPDNKRAFYKTDEIIFLIEANDVDGDVLLYQLKVDEEITAPWQSETEIILETTGIDLGIHLALIEVKDSKEKYDTEELEFCLFRKAPLP